MGFNDLGVGHAVKCLIQEILRPLFYHICYGPYYFGYG